MNLQTLEPCNETSCPSKTKTNSWAGYPQPCLSWAFHQPTSCHFCTGTQNSDPCTPLNTLAFFILGFARISLNPAPPWREEPGRLQSMGSQRAGHDWATEDVRTHAHYTLEPETLFTQLPTRMTPVLEMLILEILPQLGESSPPRTVLTVVILATWQITGSLTHFSFCSKQFIDLIQFKPDKNGWIKIILSHFPFKDHIVGKWSRQDSNTDLPDA